MQNKLVAPFAIILLIMPLLACGLLRPRATYKWHLVLELDPAAPNREAATVETVEVLNNRLNHLGVIGFKVEVVGAPSRGRVQVDLPTVTDRERFKNFIAARGLLQLVHVVSEASPAPVQSYKTEAEAKSTIAPAQDRKVLPYTVSPRPSADNEVRWVVVEHPPIVDGRDVRNASPLPMRGDDVYEIMFTLKPEAAKKFGAWTVANINQYLGVVLNDEVKSIAFIKGQIFDNGMINGHFTKQAAEDLAQILMSGPLPAAVKIVEEGDN
ncbi:MAG TPA: hypothetical protein VLA93_09540 [Pyrinomonadaceae bacterium]|nr:hypothetical protein [Pyrinomonadaceae bacterium]